MKLKSEVRIKKPALTPALSPREREKWFPRLCKIQVLDLRWFRGSMRELLIRGNLSRKGATECGAWMPRVNPGETMFSTEHVEC
jgi:hypothetical protein